MAQGSVREVMANRWDRLALASVLAGAIVRIIWGLVIHPPFDHLYSDMGAYVERAQRLAVGAGLLRADAFFPPGTHALLAAPMTLLGTERVGLWGGAVMWCALSAAIPFFAWRLARLLLTPPAAALTALFCAFWPLYITYGGYFTSETPSLAFLLASLWAGYRAAQLSGREAGWLGLAAGLLGGVAVANRPQLILNLAVLVVPLMFRLRRQALALTGILAGSALILAGTAWHNSAAAGKPTGLSENAGLNFWIGHCDVHDVTTVDPARNITFQFANPVWMQLGRGGTYYFEGRLVWDQGFFYEMGLRCIERNGLGHVRGLDQERPEHGRHDGSLAAGQRGLSAGRGTTQQPGVQPSAAAGRHRLHLRPRPASRTRPALGGGGDAAPAGLRVGGGDLLLRRPPGAQLLRCLRTCPARRPHHRPTRPRGVKAKTR